MQSESYFTTEAERFGKKHASVLIPLQWATSSLPTGMRRYEIEAVVVGEIKGAQVVSRYSDTERSSFWTGNSVDPGFNGGVSGGSWGNILCQRWPARILSADWKTLKVRCGETVHHLF